MAENELWIFSTAFSISLMTVRARAVQLPLKLAAFFAYCLIFSVASACRHYFVFLFRDDVQRDRRMLVAKKEGEPSHRKGGIRRTICATSSFCRLLQTFCSDCVCSAAGFNSGMPV